MGQFDSKLVCCPFTWLTASFMTCRQDHDEILSQVQLFLVDEVPCLMSPWILLRHNLIQVHILNESRGSTLEVVISRMKLRGSDVRFVLVSATVPNIEDIASWIGTHNSTDPARVFQVGICPIVALD
jgi:ATP-dependent DNA helicase HFM1/MER3